MEISYTFRLSDYSALAKAMRSQKRRRIEKISVWAIAFFNIVFGFISLAGGVDGALNWTGASINIGIGLAVLAVFYLLVPWAVRYNFKRTSLGGQTIRVKLEDDAVVASQRGAQSRIEWSAIMRHSQIPTHAILWINKMQGVIIPFDAFPDAEGRDAFLGFIQSKVPLSD
ncbi:MAG: YcxB family protein [Rhizobiaceae bacterium]